MLNKIWALPILSIGKVPGELHLKLNCPEKCETAKIGWVDCLHCFVECSSIDTPALQKDLLFCLLPFCSRAGYRHWPKVRCADDQGPFGPKCPLLLGKGLRHQTGQCVRKTFGILTSVRKTCLLKSGAPIKSLGGEQHKANQEIISAAWNAFAISVWLGYGSQLKRRVIKSRVMKTCHSKQCEWHEPDGLTGWVVGGYIVGENQVVEYRPEPISVWSYIPEWPTLTGWDF